MQCVESNRSGPLEEEAIKVGTTQQHRFSSVVHEEWFLIHEVNLQGIEIQIKAPNQILQRKHRLWAAITL